MPSSSHLGTVSCVPEIRGKGVAESGKGERAKQSRGIVVMRDGMNALNRHHGRKEKLAVRTKSCYPPESNHLQVRPPALIHGP